MEVLKSPKLRRSLEENPNLGRMIKSFSVWDFDRPALEEIQKIHDARGGGRTRKYVKEDKERKVNMNDILRNHQESG